MSSSLKKIIHVAVGVIENAEGEILIARRAAHQHQGNLWEFPGGKVEADELVHAALARELKEELGIEIRHSEPLIQIRHHYADKSVFLDVRHVKNFEGEPYGKEGQPTQWVSKARLGEFDFPAANKAIVSAIQLPTEILITGEAHSADDFCHRLERVLSVAHNRPSAVMLRPSRSINQLSVVWGRAIKICQNHDVPMFLNSSWLDWEEFASSDQLAGVHLTSKALLSGRRPILSGGCIGASCHSVEEVNAAVSLGVDYVLLSPIKATTSHPDARPLNEGDVVRIISDTNLPVYGLGGLNRDDVSRLKELGMQGYAAISGFGW